MVVEEAAWQGRRSYASASAAGGLQGLQALSLRRWPPLGAFIKLPALRGVHDGDVGVAMMRKGFRTASDTCAVVQFSAWCGPDRPGGWSGALPPASTTTGNTRSI